MCCHTLMLWLAYPCTHVPAHASISCSANCVIKMQEGSVHTVKIARLMDYGAIVEFPSGSSSLLHISQLSHTRVQKHTWLSPSAVVT